MLKILRRSSSIIRVVGNPRALAFGQKGLLMDAKGGLTKVSRTKTGKVSKGWRGH